MIDKEQIDKKLVDKELEIIKAEITNSVNQQKWPKKYLREKYQNF